MERKFGLESVSLPSSDLGPEGMYRLHELHERVGDVLRKLRGQVSQASYEVFHRRFFRHEGIKQIAAALRLTPKAAQHRYDRAASKWRLLTQGFGLPEWQ